MLLVVWCWGQLADYRHRPRLHTDRHVSSCPVLVLSLVPSPSSSIAAVSSRQPRLTRKGPSPRRPTPIVIVFTVYRHPFLLRSVTPLLSLAVRRSSWLMFVASRASCV